MGYYIFSFGIDTAKVRAVFGSKDETLYKEIQETETFRLYAGQDMPGDTPAKQALEDLIFGKPVNKNSAHSYWYAFIAVCAHLGRNFAGTHEIKLGYETEMIDDSLKLEFKVELNIETVLLASGHIPELPVNSDFPICGIINEAGLQELKGQLAGIEITDEMLEKLLNEDEEKEMVYDSIREIKRNVDYCLEHKLELISFCH